MERTIQIVRAYTSGEQATLLVVIPKEARTIAKVRRGTKFTVKIDDQGRLIYEPISDAR
jgi:hypothetical protein